MRPDSLEALERAAADLGEAPRTWRVLKLDSIATTMREHSALLALPSVKLAPQLLQGRRVPPTSCDGRDVYNAYVSEDGLVSLSMRIMREFQASTPTPTRGDGPGRGHDAMETEGVEAGEEEEGEPHVVVTPMVKERAKALLRTIRIGRGLMVKAEVLQTRAGQGTPSPRQPFARSPGLV